MDVRGIGSVPGMTPSKAVSPQNDVRLPNSSGPIAPRDEVEISSVGKMLDEVSQTGDLRQERLDRIRQEIADGSYDTDEKLEAALMRMLGEIGVDLDDE